MKLHLKILVLISSLLIVTDLSLFFLIQADNDRKNFLIHSLTEGQSVAVDAAFGLQAEKLDQIAIDYATWPDVPLHLNNKEWLDENVSSVITNYKCDQIWLFNPTGNQVYYASSPEMKDQGKMPFEHIGVVSTSKPVHFFSRLADGKLVEYSGTSMRSTNNQQQSHTGHFGYLLVGKEIEGQVISKLEKITNSKVVFEKPTLDKHFIQTEKIFLNEKGKECARFYFLRESSIIEDWNRLEIMFFVTTLLMVFAFTVLTYFFINKWVTSPLKKIHTALTTNDTSSLSSVLELNNELGLVAVSIKKYFDINQELSKEVNISNRIESKLKAYTLELKEVNAAKDKFLSLIAHDVSNPLNNLVGFSELLALNCKNYDADKIQKFARVLNHDAINSAELLKNLLFWARGQSGTMVFSPDRIDLNGCVDEIRDLYASSAEFRNVSIKVTSNGDTHLVADRNMICSIIRNLLSNALKFTPAGGTVSIFLDAMSDTTISFTISDTGVGMTKEQLGNLFVNAAKSTMGIRGEHGTGLGLYLCKEFAERHDGSFIIESEPKVGSKFTITLPKNILK